MKLPAIDVNPEVAGPAGQQAASLDDVVPGWRQVDSAMRGAGGATQDIYQGGEVAALAAQRAALASGEIGDAIQRLTDPIEKRYVQLDVSNAQITASRLKLQMHKYALDKIKSGDVHDANLTEGFLNDFDQQTSDVVNQANTPEGKLYLAHNLAEMRSNLGAQVMLGQSQRAGEQIKSDNLTMVNNSSEITRINPAMAPQVLKDFERDTRITTKMLGGDSALTDKMLAEGGKVIAVGTVDGMILTNPNVVKQQLALPLEKRDPIFQAVSPYLDGPTQSALAHKNDDRIKSIARDDINKKQLARQEEIRANDIQASSAISMLRKGQIPEVMEMLKNPNYLAQSPGLKGHLSNMVDAEVNKETRIPSNPVILSKALADVDSGKMTTYAQALQLFRPFNPQESLSKDDLGTIEHHLQRKDTESGKVANGLETKLFSEAKKSLTLHWRGQDNIVHADESLVGKWIGYHRGKVEENEAAGVPHIQSVISTWQGKDNPNWTGHAINSFRISPDQERRWGVLMFGGKYTEAQHFLDTVHDPASVPAPPPPQRLKPQTAPPSLEFEDPAARVTKDTPFPITGAPFRYVGRKLKQGLDWMDRTGQEAEQERLNSLLDDAAKKGGAE